MVTVKKVATGSFTSVVWQYPKHNILCSPPLVCYRYVFLLASAFKVSLLYSVKGLIHCLIAVSFCLTELQFLFPEGSSLSGLGKETRKIFQKNSNDILHHTK